MGLCMLLKGNAPPSDSNGQCLRSTLQTDQTSTVLLYMCQHQRVCVRERKRERDGERERERGREREIEREGGRGGREGVVE